MCFQLVRFDVVKPAIVVEFELLVSGESREAKPIFVPTWTRIEMAENEFTGIWLQWVDRDREKEEGPFILVRKLWHSIYPFKHKLLFSFQIGKEGQDEKEANKVDLSTLTYRKHDRQVVWGFEHGWKGNEVRRPLINSVFSPEFITFNGVLDSRPVGYKVSSVCKKLPIVLTGGELDSLPIIIAGCVFLALALLVGALIWFCCPRKNK